MNIEVRLFATLRQGRFERQTLELPDATRIGDVAARLGLRADELGIVMVNGQAAGADRLLHSGDILALFPAVAGG